MATSVSAATAHSCACTGSYSLIDTAYGPLLGGGRGDVAGWYITATSQWSDVSHRLRPSAGGPWHPFPTTAWRADRLAPVPSQHSRRIEQPPSFVPCGRSASLTG